MLRGPKRWQMTVYFSESFSCAQVGRPNSLSFFFFQPPQHHITMSPPAAAAPENAPEHCPVWTLTPSKPFCSSLSSLCLLFGALHLQNEFSWLAHVRKADTQCYVLFCSLFCRERRVNRLERPVHAMDALTKMSAPHHPRVPIQVGYLLISLPLTQTTLTPNSNVGYPS